MSADSQPASFLGLPPPLRDPEGAAFHVLPVPLEATVTYGGGTAKGPEAIIAASAQVELFDGRGVPAEEGIYTDAPLPVSGVAPLVVLARVEARTRESLTAGRIPAILGGEHTITVGAVKALVSGGRRFGVVQLDAHADLRDEYAGSKFNHACTMRRVLDLGVPIFQVGVRSLSEEEANLRDARAIPRLDAAELARRGVPETVLPEGFPSDIYLTIDVDALDPSLVPATGTPEPGGLLWYDTLTILDRVVCGRRVLGFDVVELAPIAGMHSPDFTVARLVYEVMGAIVRHRASADGCECRPAEGLSEPRRNPVRVG